MAETVPEEVLLLIVRFTAAIPDLPLTISSPKTTTTLSLKRLIRANVPVPFSENRLRLIHAGKVLADSSPLSISLKYLPPPPRDTKPGSDARATSNNGKGKGKEPAYDGDDSLENVRRVYIHCSIGDPLDASELESEASTAASLEAGLRAAVSAKSEQLVGQTSNDISTRPVTSTSTAPQGFDRLLNAGFTASEVASLRSQFLSNIAYTHTPDTMPSGAALRALEDRWLDTSAQEQAAGGSATAADGETTTAWGGGFDSEDGGLEDILWGNLLGFFWPIGALIWGMREEGVWTTRRKVAVTIGCLVNIVFGFVKWNS